MFPVSPAGAVIFTGLLALLASALSVKMAIPMCSKITLGNLPVVTDSPDNGLFR